MIIDLIDGTYELFRHFYGLRRFTKGEDRPFGAVVGVLNGVLEMIESEVTHVGVATDHVIESFRNRLWPGYKTGEGIEPALGSQMKINGSRWCASGRPIRIWPSAFVVTVCSRSTERARRFAAPRTSGKSSAWSPY